MAASCSQNSSSDSPAIPHGGWKQLSDCVYEVSRPSDGYFDLEVVFLHGFCSKGDSDAYYRTWMKADGSGNWLDTLLTVSFPRARILSVSYDSSLMTSFCSGRMDMYLLGESLVQSLVDLAGVGSRCPVVLVGHCLGGMVLKKIVLFAESSANEERSSKSVSRPYQRFMEHLRGAFFLSTPHLGSDVLIQDIVHEGGPLLEILKLLGTESARMNAEFLKLRIRYKWRTFGVFPANQTATTKLLSYLADSADAHVDWESVPQYISLIGEASARADTDGFYVISGVDHFTISRSSASFAHLISFLRKIKEEEEEYAAQLQRSFGLHTKILDLDHRVDNVIKALRLEASEPLRLALVGIDGIGKSTLTKQVVNVIRHQFEYICYVELEGVKRSRRRKQLEGLVAQNLCYPNGRSVGIGEGKQAWFVIRGKKVLIIIDDVESEDEISELLTPNWCGDGSRLIITSSRQDWSQLIVHRVPSLSEEASYQLLVTYLHEAVVRFIPHQLILQVVDECDGLPLVLEIMGKYLRNKRDVDIWSGALKRLQTEDSIDGRSEGNALWKKLHVSFRSLAEVEKSIFLDLTTFDFFPPDGRQYDLQIFQSAWIAHWDRGVLKVALLNLEERSFLFLEAENHPHNSRHGRLIGPSKSYVWIHKQLRHMGRWISRPEKSNPKECRWISQFSDLEALLINCKDTSNVSQPKTEVLSICMENKKSVRAGSESRFQNTGLPVQWSCMSRLEALRLLRISNMHFMGSDRLEFPLKLALLHMENCTRMLLKENWWLPFGRLSSWPLDDDHIQKLGALCVLIFENCSFVQLPQNFHMLQNLEVLQIHSGEKPMGQLPENIGFLPSLKHLLLDVSVKRLPNSLLRLPALQSLALSGEHLQTWPTPTTVDPYCHLTVLRKLHLKDLPALVELPDTFGGLASLEDLEIQRCSALKKLPEGFGALSKLRRLSVRSCSNLEMLCESFSSLSQLRRLTLDRLPKLKMLPVTMGDLSSLEDVNLDECDTIRELPESFASLQSLLYLRIWNCDELQGLPKFDQLKSLKNLSIICCSKCSYSPDFLLHLISAKSIKFIYVGYRADGVDDNERELPEPLKQISSLCTSNSNGPQELPVSVELSSPLEESPVRWTSATSSQVEDYTNSTGVPGFVGQPSDLYELTLTDCKLTSRSLMRRLGSLRDLRLERCGGVADILEAMMMCTGMQTLHIINCQTFSTLPNSLGNLALLTHLDLKDCQDLISLPESVGQLTSLCHLEIVNCCKLTCLPVSLGELRNLKTLYLEKCRSIVTVPHSVYHMTWLQKLVIFDCKFPESMIVRSLKERTRLEVLGLSTWNGLICLQELIDSVRPEVIRLPGIIVKCMECADIVVPSEDTPRKILSSIDDSCGCIHVIDFLKCLESYLSYRGSLSIGLSQLLFGEVGSMNLYQYWKNLDKNHVTVKVACGRVKLHGVRELRWIVKTLQFQVEPTGL